MTFTVKFQVTFIIERHMIQAIKLNSKNNWVLH
jgi:hypothetical protein